MVRAGEGLCVEDKVDGFGLHPDPWLGSRPIDFGLAS